MMDVREEENKGRWRGRMEGIEYKKWNCVLENCGHLIESRISGFPCDGREAVLGLDWGRGAADLQG